MVYDWRAFGDTPRVFEQRLPGAALGSPVDAVRACAHVGPVCCCSRARHVRREEGDGARRCEGTGTLGFPAAAGIVAFFGDTIVAAVLGVVFGAALLALTAAGVRMFTPETLEIGMVRTVVMMVLGLVLAFCALLAYFLYVRAGLVPFGLGLVTGFMVPALIALFRTSGIASSSTARR